MNLSLVCHCRNATKPGFPGQALQQDLLQCDWLGMDMGPAVGQADVLGHSPPVLSHTPSCQHATPGPFKGLAFQNRHSLGEVKPF